MPTKPKPENRASAKLYTPKYKERAAEWGARLRRGPNPPDDEQWKVLDVVMKRCAREASEENSARFNPPGEEPLRMFVHGLPGCGKSNIIKWLTRFFQEVLQWQHGVEYHCLAPMNSMASLIHGRTFHNFAMLPLSLETGQQPGGKKTRRQQANKLFTSLQHTRFLLMDEVENVSAELLAASEKQTSDSTRNAGSYKLREDGRQKTSRPFGGINVVMFLDLWQVPPVRLTSIAANPFGTHTAKVKKILDMFWTQVV